MTEYHYDMPGEMMKEYGLKRYVESHEAARANMTDGMDCKRYADIPMSAIWMRYKQKHISEPQFESDIRESASVAHIFGQNIAAAESFTTDGDRDGAFVYSPSVLKPTADKAMACGLNRFVIHTSPHQPVDNKFPGLGLGKWGQWFDRHETWAGMANHWTDYLSRSCFLLQQGKFVADVAFFYGEGTNITARYQTKMPKFPKGYNYDFVNPTILCDVLQVDNGELTTKTGMRYKVLWLDKGEQIAFSDDVQGVCDSYEAFLRAPAGTKPKFVPEEIAAKRAVAKAEAERLAAERRRQEEERRRKAAEAAAELARLRADSAKLAEVRRILKGART